MREAVIVDAIRTPLGRGKKNGALAGWHAVDLAAEPIRALADRTGIDPSLIEDVIMGCVGQVGEQGLNIARNAALAAGLPETVCGTTVDRQCGSSQQALHFAAQGVMAGAYDCVIAAGVESMSRVPMGTTAMVGGAPFGPKMIDRYVKANLYGRGGLVNQGLSAEEICKKWGLKREQLDEFSARSHQLAARATDNGWFAHEIIPIERTHDDGKKEMITIDEGIRPDSTAEKLGVLKPAFEETGMITAANSSQITDGAAAVLVMERKRAEELGLKPRARFHAFALGSCDPVIMLTAPIPATHNVLKRAGMKLSDIDAVEINEAFAPVVLAWARDLEADMSKVNPNGGAIALGHPLGASGARLMTTLLNQLERSGGRYGLQTMCEGGGMANATIIERLA
ncbi:MAG TPA: thiolase family protein [Candidatus Limnocylindrales bacterium]|nr:thiolase family protein [Candidatus Limnocylindrales bacterium]